MTCSDHQANPGEELKNARALTQQYFTLVLGINDSSQHMLDWLRERGFVVTQEQIEES